MKQRGNDSPSTKVPKASLRPFWQRADTSGGGHNAAASIWNCAMEQGGNVSPSTKEPSVSRRSCWHWDRIQCGCIGLEPCHETGGSIGVVPEEVCKSAVFVLSFHLLLSKAVRSLPSISCSANPDNLFPPSASQQTRTIPSLHPLRRTGRQHLRLPFSNPTLRLLHLLLCPVFPDGLPQDDFGFDNIQRTHEQTDTDAG